jgi:hypothetical protein
MGFRFYLVRFRHVEKQNDIKRHTTLAAQVEKYLLATGKTEGVG